MVDDVLFDTLFSTASVILCSFLVVRRGFGGGPEAGPEGVRRGFGGGPEGSGGGPERIAPWAVCTAPKSLMFVRESLS